MSRRTRIDLSVTAACIALVLAFSLSGFATPYTPLDWQQAGENGLGQIVEGKFIGWSRDQNIDFVDDYIEWILATEGPNERVNVIVDFNRCVTCSEDDPLCVGGGETIEYLNEIGTVSYVGQVLTYAVVLDMRAAEAAVIAARPEVAMVEWLVPLTPSLDQSLQAIRVRNTAAFAGTEVDTRFPNIDGSGVNIAILDTGVDNAGGTGTTHNMFPAGTFVGGANTAAVNASGNRTTVIGDPDDENGHGTHVAGIALGRQVVSGGQTLRGVAPGAGLVDIRVLRQNPTTGRWTTFGGSELVALELAIQRRTQWNIGVINMSLNGCNYNLAQQLTNQADGRGAIPQLINTVVANGIVVVVSVGNTVNCDANRNTPGHQNPPNNNNFIDHLASADLAITVGAVNDNGTAALGNDAISTFSDSGPRIADGDADTRDENKPEICAPGENIRSATFNTASGFTNMSGTSMAAPHVAGAAALILERSPGITPGIVKELLISTAAQSNKPGAHPGWNTMWGHGFLNVLNALDPSPGVVSRDVGRATNPSPTWMSTDISTGAPPRIGTANTMSAVVRNYSSDPAPSVRVTFGIHRLGNVGMKNRYFEIGSQTLTIPGNATRTFTINWTPPAALREASFPANQPIHACAKASIDYPWDTSPGNNTMQRNMDVAQASVAQFPFRVVNNLDEAATIMLVAESDPPEWRVRFLENCEQIEPTFEMDPYKDCPRDLIVELIPPDDALPGDEGQVIVRAITEEGQELGGATLIGRVSAVERYTFTVLEALYDTLLGLDFDGQLIPQLAEWWEVSDDGLTIYVRLRQGVVFHNKELLTAEVAAESLRISVELWPGHLREPLLANPLIDSISVQDEHTLVFQLTDPLPGEFLALLAIPTTAIAFPFGPSLVGTGPFLMEELIQDDYVVLASFAYYWKGAVPLKKLKYIIVPEEATRLWLLENRAVDAIVSRNTATYWQLADDGDFWLNGIPCDFRAVAKSTVDEFNFHVDNILRLWDAGYLGTDVLRIAVPEL